MSTFATVELLEKHLSTRSYVTGYSLSADDKKELAALKVVPSKASHPNVARWATHIAALTGVAVAASASPAAAAAAAASAPAPASKATAADDDMDFGFGDDDEELNDEGETAAEAAATKARQERMQKALELKQQKDAEKAAASGKKVEAKEKMVEKSLVVLEVKPWEADTDLVAVWNQIKEYKQEGLVWGESYKLEPVAYGIMKLVMTCTIVDALVLLDDVTENIEAIDQYVQSVNIASMNKI